jgi:uncharacterized protein
VPPLIIDTGSSNLPERDIEEAHRMPVTPTFPGVYIEEIPSGVHTIVGVATSITAFVGGAEKGPVDRATTIFSFGDFVRAYGDLNVAYPMSYAVRDFYNNGGSQAVIVRVYHAPDDGSGASQLAIDSLTVEASSPGPWGDILMARVDDKVSEDVATSWGLTKDDLFNLKVRLGPTGTQETFRNVTVKESPRRVDRVLEAESTMVRFPSSGTLPDAVPAPSPAPKPNPDVDPDKNVDPWDPAVDADGKTFSGAYVVADDGKGAASGTLGLADYEGDEGTRTGLHALDAVDLFNLMCVLGPSRDADPPDGVYAAALTYCVNRRAFLVVDAPTAWTGDDLVSNAATRVTDLGLAGVEGRNAAVYFPRVKEADPLRGGQIDIFPASGALAGLMARTDGQRGVWKAPAGVDASVNGTAGLAYDLTDKQNGALNQVGINCLRTFPVYGRVCWGARTLRGADQAADEYKYVPVRRTALFLEESLYRGLKWVVFEPNDEPLWAQIRLNVGAFLQSLFRQGAFQGTTPRQAYFVKCDSETTTQDDINKGIVNIVVGFAPLKPAEFVIVKLQQMAGQIEV